MFPKPAILQACLFHALNDKAGWGEISGRERTSLQRGSYFMYPLRANSIIPLHIYLSHTHIGHKYTHAHTGPADTQLLFRDVRAMGLPQSGTPWVLRLQAPGHLGRAQEVNWHLASNQSTRYSDWSVPDFNWPPFVSQAKSPEAELLLPEAPSHTQCNNLCDFSTPQCAMSVLRRALKLVPSITHRPTYDGWLFVLPVSVAI